MNKFKKAAALFMATTMCLSFAGCGTQQGNSTIVDDGNADYPETLSIFCAKSASLMDDMTDYNDVYGFQLLEEKTGTHVEWTIPPGTGFEEKFNLMIAGGTLPDAIVANWNTKGIEQYIDDGVAVDISQYVEKYAPNLMAFSKENPTLARDYIFDGGKIYYFPLIRGEKKLNIFTGPVIRTDWLQKLNLEVPTNKDELYAVLKAFKEKDPNGNGQADEIPMSAYGAGNALQLVSMWGTKNNFYIEDGNVKYGIMEDSFEEGLAYVAKLYSEGLLDIDYVLQDRTAMVGKITNNQVGYAYEYQPTQIMTNMADKDPSFKFEGIPNFKDNNGVIRSMESAYVNGVLDRSAVITTANKNPLGTMKWFDFLYGEEGRNISNFGKEGDTYEMKDGIPTFTEKIDNNQEGLTRSQVWGKNFITYNTYFPGIQDWYSYSQYLSEDGKKAIETWEKDVVTDKVLPTLTLSEEDREIVKSTYTQIETYVNEQLDKIILGQVSVSELPAIRETVKKMGIDTIIAIYQKAYDNYATKDIGF